MDLGDALEQKRDELKTLKEREMSQEEGGDCKLTLQLPDGKTVHHVFKMGVTVAYVKLQVQELYGLAMAKQTLQLNGKTLIDPFSLADCPGITPAGATVVVTVTA